jgi:hypothetical protein
VGDFHLLFFASFLAHSAAGIKCERGAEAVASLALPDHHVQCRAGTVRPALQKDAVTNDVVAASEKRQRACGIQRPNRFLVDVITLGISVGEAAEAMRLAARTEAVGSSAMRPRAAQNSPHMACLLDNVEALQAERVLRETNVQFALSLTE